MKGYQPKVGDQIQVKSRFRDGVVSRPVNASDEMVWFRAYHALICLNDLARCQVQEPHGDEYQVHTDRVFRPGELHVR